MDIVNAILKVVSDLVAFFGPIVGLLGGGLGVAAYLEARRPTRPAVNIQASRLETIIADAPGVAAFSVEVTVWNPADRSTVRWTDVSVAGPRAELMALPSISRPRPAGRRLALHYPTMEPTEPFTIGRANLQPLEKHKDVVLGPSIGKDTGARHYVGLIAADNAKSVTFRLRFRSDTLGGFSGKLAFKVPLPR